jgi:hypothetical protein
MNQLEYDTLKIFAGQLRIEALNRDWTEREKQIARRHSDELMQIIRQMKTEPAEPEGEPERLPPMRWPSEIPTGVEDPK